MTESNDPPPRVVGFMMGRLQVDDDAHEVAAKAGASIVALLRRHSSGDFGDAVAPDLRDRNRRAVLEGLEIKSLYRLSSGVVIAIRTNSFRSETRVDVVDDIEGLL